MRLVCWTRSSLTNSRRLLEQSETTINHLVEFNLFSVVTFFQLPPVGLSGRKGGREVDPAHFCFESKSWKMCIQRSIVLDQIFRQKDQAFVNILNEIRKGRVSEEAERQLQSAGKVVKQLRESNSDIKPTLLYALNRDVDRINETELQKCKGEEKAFVAKDTGQQPFVDQLKRNCTAPETLRLRIGAQVILLQVRVLLVCINPFLCPFEMFLTES
eukprot:gb/GECG01010598.1/.p1 GENE.gb/GECG01010598.1/~~gb/GECG01010598.1/.p1  ORF type:complete len:215 (+),score=13.44 gb/GECG01010598.1/:1-645(+)